jgi:hypothetical protein
LELLPEDDWEVLDEDDVDFEKAAAIWVLIWVEYFLICEHPDMQVSEKQITNRYIKNFLFFIRIAAPHMYIMVL